MYGYLISRVIIILTSAITRATIALKKNVKFKMKYLSFACYIVQIHAYLQKGRDSFRLFRLFFPECPKSGQFSRSSNDFLPFFPSVSFGNMGSREETKIVTVQPINYEVKVASQAPFFRLNDINSTSGDINLPDCHKNENRHSVYMRRKMNGCGRYRGIIS